MITISVAWFTIIVLSAFLLGLVAPLLFLLQLIWKASVKK